MWIFTKHGFFIACSSAGPFFYRLHLSSSEPQQDQDGADQADNGPQRVVA